MGFEVEYGESQFDISVVDYERGWRLIGGGGGQDRIRHFLLVDAKDNNRVLSYFDVIENSRELNGPERESYPDIEMLWIYRLVGFGPVLSLDKAQSRKVFEGAIIARNKRFQRKVRSGETPAFLEIFE